MDSYQSLTHYFFYMMTESLSSTVLTVLADTNNLPEKVKKTKRTLLISEEIDHKVRVFAAHKRISVGSLVEAALVLYFSQNLSQQNTEM
ncbi:MULTISPECIES: hypothetical protein [unclassified Microcoleus]|uniref:hypothetical protein n=1 Tax=unclassified Microcoleus TaxID=2642155 RepID=UPI002FD0B54E